MTSNDDELARFTIGGTGTKHPGFEIPAPPASHPNHDRPRAGFAGDDRAH